MQFTIVTPEPDPTLLNDLCDPLLGIYDASEEPDEELGVPVQALILQLLLRR